MVSTAPTALTTRAWTRPPSEGDRVVMHTTLGTRISPMEFRGEVAAARDEQVELTMQVPGRPRPAQMTISIWALEQREDWHGVVWHLDADRWGRL